MADHSFSIRVKKFQTNPLLQRKQFCLDVLHPGRVSVSKADVRSKIAKMYKASDPRSVVLYGFQTQFGGGRSSGFGLIYDTIGAAKKFERKFRLVQLGLLDAKTKGGRRGKKELKNRKKKLRGTAKNKVAAGKKK